MIIDDAKFDKLADILQPLVGKRPNYGLLTLLEVNDAGDTNIRVGLKGDSLGEVALGGTRDTDIILVGPDIDVGPLAIHAITFQE